MAGVVIVGGGVIGCATAYFLARDGANVALVERGELASEASGASAGMLAALSGEGEDRGAAFDALCAYSSDCYRELIPQLASTGIDLYHQRSGVLRVAITQHEADVLRKMRTGDARLLEGDDILKEEPQLGPRAVAALLTSNEEYVDSAKLTQALAALAQTHGAEIRTNAPVTGFARRGNRVTGVRTPAGLIEAETVLLAAGPWTQALAKRLGVYVPVRPVRGQMLSLDGPPAPLRRPVWGMTAYLVPREDGQTYVGATLEEAGYRKRTTAKALSLLRRGAEELVPALRQAKQRRAWAGLRPATPDGLPVMGRLPGWRNVWVASGHFRNGILLAPGSAQLLAQSIRSGNVDQRLAAFTPDRFHE